MVSNLTVKVGADIDSLQRELTKATSHLRGFEKGINSVSSTLKSMVAGFGLYEIGRGVIETTSQFQKFAAVLENTVGDKSKAQRALNDIREFALTTPYEVSEVTAAYVRWANQGLSPTIDRMSKLGDVAASLGAGFEQTAEAFKDLAVGQTKRIEEIGISAQQSNGKIQLSFKGVNLEIEKNAEGVQKALDVYSQLNGVLGTSDAVSKTLGGRISNLKDAWSGLMLSIGEGTSGPLFGVVESLTTITNALASFRQEMALIGQAVSPFHDLRDVSKETLDYLIKFGRTDTGSKLAEVLKPFTSQENRPFLLDFDTNYKKFVETLTKEGESLTDINVLWQHLVKTKIEAVKLDNESAKAARYAAVMKQKELAAQQLAGAQGNQVDPRTNVTTPVAKGGYITGAGFLQDVGIIDSASTQIRNALAKIDSSVIVNKQSLESWGESMRIMFEQQMQNAQQMKSIVDGALIGIGEALGSAINGSQTLGAGLLKVIGGVLTQLGTMLITAGLGVEAFKKSLQSLNGYAAIAAGIALVAIGTAVAGSIKSLGSSAGSSGGGGGGSSRSSSLGHSSQSINSSGIEIKLPEGEWRISGNDLVYIFNRNNQLKGRTG
jgi:hypothetical protein